jgi:KDO2-lipid IV(A) lauroyltransferase
VSLLTPIRYRLEYLAARAGLALIDAFPVKGCPGLAAVAGDLVYLFDLRRRRIAVDNILKAGLAATPGQARRIARGSFRHFCLLLIESLKMQRLLTPASLPAHVTLDIPPETQALFDDRGKGLLGACGHFGNWEIMAQVFGFMKPVVAVAQPAKNPLVNRLMERRTPDARFRTIPKHDDDMMRLMQTLKDGCALAIMIDQHAMKKPMVVDFFGRPACSHRSIALLHLVTRVPIVFGACRRTGLMRFAITLSKPLVFKPSGNKDKDVHDILKTLNEKLEAAIREAPDQYMWGHRRWRPPNPNAFLPKDPASQAE